MPLSPEKLVSFFVQGAFCDATIFGFLVLNVSISRFFWCHYLRILWCSFCTRQFCWCHYLRFFWCQLCPGHVFFDATIFGKIGIIFCSRRFLWCHYLWIFDVKCVHEQVFLMPLSSDFLVLISVQGRSVDATIFVFLRFIIVQGCSRQFLGCH